MRVNTQSIESFFFFFLILFRADIFSDTSFVRSSDARVMFRKRNDRRFAGGPANPHRSIRISKARVCARSANFNYFETDSYDTVGRDIVPRRQTNVVHCVNIYVNAIRRPHGRDTKRVHTALSTSHYTIDTSLARQSKNPFKKNT